MTAESKGLIALGGKRETTSIATAACSRNRPIRPRGFLFVSPMLFCTVSGCACKDEKPAQSEIGEKSNRWAPEADREGIDEAKHSLDPEETVQPDASVLANGRVRSRPHACADEFDQTRLLSFAANGDFTQSGWVGQKLDQRGGLTMGREKLSPSVMRMAILCLLASAPFPSVSRTQEVPVFEISAVESWIKFDVKASMDIAGKFDTRDANLTFTSPDETAGVLQIKIQAESVDTGSDMQNGTLNGKGFFDVEHNPIITFKSTKIVQTGHDTYAVDGDLAVRGVSSPEKLTPLVSSKGTGSNGVKGKMVFNRTADGMTQGIPLIKIADQVEVNFHPKAQRASGPRLLDS